MPAISVWLLRLSLVSLLAGGAAGGWLLSHEPWSSTWLPRLRAAHVHLMLFGWLIPFVMGTAYWILPRHTSGEPRGSPQLATIAASLIGAGTILGATGALANSALLQRIGTVAVVAGAGLFVSLL